MQYPISYKLKSWLKSVTTPAMLTYWSAVATVTLMLVIFTAVMIRELRFAGPTPWYVVDALIGLLPYFFIRPRWRWTVWIPIVLTLLYLLANICYLRAFGDLMPFESVGMAGQLEGVVMDSALQQFRWVDLLLLLPLLLFVVAWFMLRRRARQETFGRRARMVAVALTIFSFLLMWIVRANSKYPEDCDVSRAKYTVDFYNRVARSDMYQTQLLGDMGFTLYFYQQLTGLLFSGISDEERAEVDQYVASVEPSQLPDSIAAILKENRNKNLIFIVVESLSANAPEQEINGRKVAPFISSLMTDSTVLVYDNVLSQVSHGRSSDGQFMYQTGLLPLRDGRVAQRYAKQSYYAMPKALAKHNSMEVIGENATFYNHHFTTLSYGYDRLDACNTDSHQQCSWDGDSAIFERAYRNIQMQKQPMLCFVTTLEMHEPYTMMRHPRRFSSQVSGYDSRELVYLERLAVVDDALKKLFNRLKTDGLYDNSIIVIASDHEPRGTDLAETTCITPQCLFMVIGAGVGGRDHEVIGQIDVYPTVLDIMGIADYPWRGVGHSALREPKVRAAVDRMGSLHGHADNATTQRLKNAWDISSYIIKGHYYGEKLP